MGPQGTKAHPIVCTADFSACHPEYLKQSNMVRSFRSPKTRPTPKIFEALITRSIRCPSFSTMGSSSTATTTASLVCTTPHQEKHNESILMALAEHIISSEGNSEGNSSTPHSTLTRQCRTQKHGLVDCYDLQQSGIDAKQTRGGA